LVCLVGNKDDEPDRKVVPTSDAQKYCQQLNIPFFETSAKENKNVEEVRWGLYILMLIIIYSYQLSVVWCVCNSHVVIY